MVDAVGLDNQGESCLAWDAVTGEPLTPIIVWQDSRTSEWIGKLRAEDAEELTLSKAGLPLEAYFSASKLGWIVQNVDAARQALKAGRLRLGTTDAFFLDRLTGCYVTDVTTASLILYESRLRNLGSSAVRGVWRADRGSSGDPPDNRRVWLHRASADHGLRGRSAGRPLRARLPPARGSQDHVRNRCLRPRPHRARNRSQAGPRLAADSRLEHRRTYRICP